ncbi:MAG: hypothetical protein N2327_08100 [Caldimicrobium sp.]|nr:hypothetical protein [Caldimicrobium sp.]MCX7874369.1 hypothetical protein [Caldimicrobium sp.]MDW8093495.1 hypothetical protein [Caldimicrobium sp.]
MKKFISLMLSLAVAGVLGITAGCKKKEEAPAPTPPKVEQPAANQTNQTEAQPANQTGTTPAEKK